MSRHLYLPALVLLGMVALLPASVSAEEAGEATAFVQQRADEIIRIINREAADADARNTRREDLRRAIRGFLSYELLAERTLGTHWEARSEEERAAFVLLLRELIETSYLRRLGTDRVTPDSYRVEYTGERVRRTRATVSGRVSARGETAQVDVRMQAAPGGGWLIHDVVTDDVSMEESYAESFDRIIRDEGWDALVQRLRDRIAEMQR